MLATGCARAGRPVVVAGPAEAAAAAGLENVRFEVVPIGERPHPGRDMAVVRRLRLLLAANAPDVIHAHGLRAGGLAALALGRSPGERRPRTHPPALVVTVHNAPPPGVAAGVIYGLLERLVARRADVVLCVSSDLLGRMSRRGAREVGRAIVPAPEPPLARVGIDMGIRPMDLSEA